MISVLLTALTKCNHGNQVHKLCKGQTGGLFYFIFLKGGGGININNFRTINTEIVCDYFTFILLILV